MTIQFASLSILVLLLAGYSRPGFSIDETAGEIKLGESSLFPAISLIYFNDDNVFATSKSEVESKGLEIVPELLWVADIGSNNISMNYKANLVSFADTDNADYSDHSLNINSNLTFSRRSQLELDVRLRKQHISFGDNLSRTLDENTDEAIETDQNELRAIYKYGADTARGNLEFEFLVRSIDYTNLGVLTDGFGFNLIKPTVTFLYGVSADTRIVAGISSSAFNYEKSDSIIELDSQDIEIFSGAVWEITGKSGGDFRIGFSDRDYRVKQRDDATSLALKLGAYWKPSNFSRVDINIRRGFALDTDSTSVRTTVGAKWKHNWSARIHTLLSSTWLDYDSDDENSNRNTKTLGLKLGYSLYRWLDLGLEILNTDTTSPDQDAEYERQWLGVSIDATL